jgi:hypothetical protein
VLVLLAGAALFGQVIEFESNGLKYQTLTREGVTVMFAHLPSAVREYSILQVAISNGGPRIAVVKPEDFVYDRSAGGAVRAAPAREVVNLLIEKGTRNDVIRLVSAYETALYGIERMRSTNGYEVRRRNALAEVSSTRLKAAAAASAIALVQTKLAPGQSTDGAVFLPAEGKQLAGGRLIVRTSLGVFEFNPETPAQ